MSHFVLRPLFEKICSQKGRMFGIVLFLMGFIVGVLIWFILWPCRVARNPRAANEKKKFTTEVSESAEWINRTIHSTMSQHDIEAACIKVVQKAFQESFTAEREGRIRKVHVSEVKISRKAPVFHDVQTRVDEQARVVSNLAIEYDADFEIKCDLDLAFPVIGVKTVGTLVKVKTVKGFLIITVPFEKGPIQIELKKGTDVDCDASIVYGESEIGTEALGPVWTGVRSAILAAVRMMTIKVDLLEDPDVTERGIELDEEEPSILDRGVELAADVAQDGFKKMKANALQMVAKVAADDAAKKAEEAKRKAEEEARRAEEARRKAEEEAKRKAEEAKRKAEEEARRAEEARKKAEEEAKRKAEEEARKKAEEEAKRKAEEEARKKAEEEAKRKAEEEARKKAEEEATRTAQEEEEEDEFVMASVGKRQVTETVKAEEIDKSRSSSSEEDEIVVKRTGPVQRSVVVQAESSPQVTTIVQQGEPQVIQRTVVVQGGDGTQLAVGGQASIQGTLVVGGQAPTTSTQLVVGQDGSMTQIDTTNAAMFAAQHQTMTAQHVQEVEGGRIEINATAHVTHAVAVQQTVTTTTTTTTRVVEEEEQ